MLAKIFGSCLFDLAQARTHRPPHRCVFRMLVARLTLFTLAYRLEYAQ